MIKPLRDRVLLEQIKTESMTASGIILTDATSEKPELAKVIAVGDGVKDAEGNLIMPSVSVGDIVIYKKYSTTELRHQGNDYLIIDEKDILAIIEEDN